MADTDEARRERRFLTDDCDLDEYELMVVDNRAGNGDWYISVLPKGHKIGPTVRICTSGGAARSHPALPAAAERLWRALDPSQPSSFSRRTLSLGVIEKMAPQFAVSALCYRIEEMLPMAEPSYVCAAKRIALARVFGETTAAAWEALERGDGRWCE